MADGYWGQVKDNDGEYIVICSINSVLFDKLWDYFMAQGESFSEPLTFRTFCKKAQDPKGRERHMIDVYDFEGLAKSVKYQPEE